VCPQCQRPAAVGIQCVDCVRQGAREQRTVRTQFGGAVTDGRPIVTYTLIGICVVVWLVQKSVPSFTEHLEFAPYAATHRPWTFLTAAFLHSPTDYLHILSNMYALWICGQALEPMLGRVRFAALYVISALGGSVGYLLLADPTPYVSGSPAWWTGTVGASGAVFGLFGALVVLHHKLSLPAAPIYVLIGINAVLGFVVQGIAWQAHAGGLVTGLLCSGVLFFATGRRRLQLQWAGLVAVCVLLLVVTVVKEQTVPADVSQQAAFFLGSG
jgi:membrane associated rhomboid family serine protease